MNVQQIRTEIEQLDSLPTTSPVVRKLLGIIDSQTLSLSEIGDIIAKDQAITARLLKMVNSPVYGFPGRISSVSQALILLGLNIVKGMLLGISVFEIMEKTMMGLWKHSLCVAIAARTIAAKRGLNAPEEVMVSALIHDIGKVALNIKFPEQYNSALLLSEKKGIMIRDSEEDIFGISHTDAGLWLAQKWNFPRTLLEPIAYHHNPDIAKNAAIQTAIVHMSDIIVRGRGIGFSGDYIVPVVNPGVWKELSLSDNDIKDVLTVIEDASQKAENFMVV